MGRPKKPTAANRSSWVTVRFTPAERARLLDESERLCLPVSHLVRQRSLKGELVVVQSAELAAPDRVALGRLGVNLNQIAKHLNEAGGGIPAIAEIEAEAREALRAINALLLGGLSPHAPAHSPAHSPAHPLAHPAAPPYERRQAEGAGHGAEPR